MIRKSRSVLSIFMVFIMTFGILGINFVCAEETEPKQETEHSITIDGGWGVNLNKNGEASATIKAKKGDRIYIEGSLQIELEEYKERLGLLEDWKR